MKINYADTLAPEVASLFDLREIEYAFLITLITEPSFEQDRYLLDGGEKLTSVFFFTDLQAREIFLTAMEMRQTGEFLNTNSLYSRLVMKGKQQLADFVLGLSNIGSTKQLSELHSSLQEGFGRRALLVVSRMIADKVMAGDAPDTLVSQALDLYLNVGTFISDSIDNHPDLVTFAEALRDGNQRLNDTLDRGDHMLGKWSGFSSIDDKLGGLPSGLVCVLADTGGGKTQFLSQLAQNMSGHYGNETFLFFSPEVPAYALAQRVVSSKAGVNRFELLRGFADAEDYQQYYSVSAEYEGNENILIVDKSVVTISDVSNLSLRVAVQRQVGAILIDYIQLLMPDTGSASQEYHTITLAVRTLHRLARELDIPVIVAVNANRGVKGRADKRPTLSDGHGSGFIEKMAKMYIGLFRQALYDEQASPNSAELLLLKYTDGPSGDIYPMEFSNGMWKDVDLSDITPENVERIAVYSDYVNDDESMEGIPGFDPYESADF